MKSRVDHVALLALAAAAVACSSEPGGDAQPDAAPKGAKTVSVGPAHIAPDEIQYLPADPICETCRLVFGEPFELGGAEADGGTPGGMAGVVRAADGRFAATFWGPAQSQIYIYGADGRFESTFGGEGSGPGEFRMIGNGLFADGYTLHAFDSQLGRRTSIDIRSGEVIEEAKSAGNIMNATFPSDEELVTSGRGRGSGGPGYPIHVFSRDGEWIRSFGRTEPQEDLDDTGSLVRVLATARDGTFWSAPRHEFLFEQWTPDGTRLQAFAGDRDRFIPLEEGNYADGGRPTSRLSGISVDVDGLLWVLYSVASADWEDATERVAAEESREMNVPRYRALPGRRVRDYYLEVIDPEAGQVLVRQRLPENYFGFADAETLVRGWDDDETGISKIAVVEVELRR